MGKTYKSDRDSYFDDGYADGEHRYNSNKNKERKIKNYQEHKKIDKREQFPSDKSDDDDWDEQR